MDMNHLAIDGLSVTQCAKHVKQPYGGYIRVRDFEKTQLDGGGMDDLNPQENIHASITGTAVDYLTRYVTGTSAAAAFQISTIGAAIVGEDELCDRLISRIDGLTNNTIIRACKLAGFDAAYRAGPYNYLPVQYINPDSATIENIRTMVERAECFFAQYGPKTLDGLTFEGGYTRIVSKGDGDFMTGDTLWDFKVSKYPPTSKHTLQLLMYWRMGLHSKYVNQYENVRYLGIYNPRMNIVYRLHVASIPNDVINTVESEIIGY